MDVLTHAIIAIFSIVLGGVLHAVFAPIVDRKLHQITTQRARARHAVEKLPSPPKAFPMFKLGNIELPVTVLLGTPKHPLTMAHIDVVYEPILSDAQEGFPRELKEAIPYLRDLYLSREPCHQTQQLPSPPVRHRPSERNRRESSRENNADVPSNEVLYSPCD